MIRGLLPLLLLLLLAGCLAMTPLLKAAGKGQLETVKVLIDQGADVNEESTFKTTALLEAARLNHSEVVRILLEQGANIDQQNSYGFSPLIFAAFWGNLKSVEVLLEYGADTTLVTKKGKSAAEFARRRKYPQVAQMIRAAARSPKKKITSRAAKALLDSKMASIRSYTEAGDQARKAGDKPTALKNYVSALGETPPGAEIRRELRMKIIRFVRSMKKPPPVPEDAKYHSLRAQAFLKMAKDKSGYEKAKQELETVVQIAPWWGDAYFNLGLVQEKLHDYQPAIENLKLYLTAAPNARDLAAIKKKLVELEVAQELAQ